MSSWPPVVLIFSILIDKEITPVWLASASASDREDTGMALGTGMVVLIFFGFIYFCLVVILLYFPFHWRIDYIDGKLDFSLLINISAGFEP